MKTFLKYASLLPICLITWWCTSTLMAQQRSKPVGLAQPAQSEAVKIAAMNTVKSTGTDITRIPGAVVPHLGTLAINSDVLTATHSIMSEKIEVIDGMVVVNAQVSLSSRIGKDIYMWRLSFLDAQENVLGQTLYDHQVFGMEADGAMEPTFNEVVPLISGTRSVHLSLFAFKPGTDLTIFKDQHGTEGYTILRCVKKI